MGATELEHNVTYKISSAFDGCVLDVKGGNKTKRGTQILSWDWSNSNNQKWRANGESDGFRLSTLIPPQDKDTDYLAVLDETKSSMLQLWSFNGSLSQQWMAKEVPNGGGAVLLVNVLSGKCIRNQGHHKELKLVPLSADDRSCWWNLVPV